MIQPKFEKGQTVFSASVGWSERKIQCPDCLGQKEWTVSCPSGEVFKHPCRTCTYGWQTTGLVSEWGDHARIVERTIGSIRIDTGDVERPVSYMCVETGVGTGSIYDEAHVFAERSEAEAWCASELERVKGLRMNEELEKRNQRKNDVLIHGKRTKKLKRPS